jgi:hypothetical protein
MRNHCKLLGSAMALIALFAVLSGGNTSAQPADQEAQVSQNGLFRFHKMNEQDIETMKRIIGVREPGVNYNTIVDGFGTGYAPPTEQEYETMLGDLNMVDRLTQSALPDRRRSLDLSDDPRFPKVDTQGGQGSCAAWATRHGPITRRTPDPISAQAIRRIPG